MKKWIFITTCTVVVLLSTVNVYRVLGAGKDKISSGCDSGH